MEKKWDTLPFRKPHQPSVTKNMRRPPFAQKKLQVEYLRMAGQAYGRDDLKSCIDYLMKAHNVYPEGKNQVVKRLKVILPEI